MGVDAGIFARKAKKYYWFDRETNIQGWRYTDNDKFFDENKEACGLADSLLDKLRTEDFENKGCSLKEVRFLATLSKRAWKSNSDSYEQSRSTWMDCVIRFAEMYPNDIFTIKSDHDREWADGVCDLYERVNDSDLHDAATLSEALQVGGKVASLSPLLPSGSLQFDEGKLRLAVIDGTIRSIPLSASAYQKWALTKDRPTYSDWSGRLCNDLGQLRLIHATLGISGEAGELADAVKKHTLYGKPLDVENLKEECGDVLWYMAILLHQVGSTFEEVMEINQVKLEKRYPSGFTEADAVLRKDKEGDSNGK